MSRRSVSQQRGNKQQYDAIYDLHKLAHEYPGFILSLGAPCLFQDKSLVIAITLSMSHFRNDSEHIELHDTEKFFVGFPEMFPDCPPLIEVNHERWLGCAHTLAGGLWNRNGVRLCTYLDPHREWHPDLGIKGSIERIWDFIEKLANGNFDPTTALFHPIGGIQPHDHKASTAVVRSHLGDLNKNINIASARMRSEKRIDLFTRDDTELRILTLTSPKRLIRGPGATLQELLQSVADAGGSKPEAVMGALRRTASKNGPGKPLIVLLAVSREAADAGSGHHLAAAQIDPRYSSAVAASQDDPHNALQNPVPLSWYRTADLRTETALRRDIRRPVRRLHGKRVLLCGCGALGSWIAELLVRAGVSHLTVTDLATVGPDLLVRQNYTEDDVGFPKVSQLAARLRALSDDVEVNPRYEPSQGRVAEDVANHDLIIDATVNEAFGAVLSRAASKDLQHPLLAAVSTDISTASLGLIAVSGQSSGLGPAAVDEELHHEVLNTGRLEAFQTFWNKPEQGEELIAMRGCSTPTFHGSAADAVGLAGTMVNLIAGHIDEHGSGLHLVAMPHAAVDAPAHTYIPLTR
ncbi:HesA/MoeB/ThiF family protein [Candidatus Poriferisocius sp.]|uniref:HesA/MoeB/ThiF family protein n=1 Tax=Candidatus Poriferisocius sp. TaxID=3101276 RepID=UPI003B02E818